MRQHAIRTIGDARGVRGMRVAATLRQAWHRATGARRLMASSADGADAGPDGHLTMPLDGEYAPGKSAWARKQAERFEASNGTEAATLQGKPIIVLTSVGARTGKLRKTALMRVEHDGEYAVVASKGGSATNPAWYYNLKANPHVELQDGPVKRDYTAREVGDDEKATWWARSLEVWPAYADYQRKTERLIPVFVLEPLPD
jgi:deazaflavin-dependent oxidoreductase (nitroreductase family)